MIAPTSPIARPNPASEADHNARKDWCAIDVIRGVIMITCAITIAWVEKSNPKTPKGPERDSKIYTINPTTTGGNPIRAFNVEMINLRYLNLRTAKMAAKGNAIRQETNKALSVTRKERSEISTKSASSVSVSQMACWMPFQRSSIKRTVNGELTQVCLGCVNHAVGFMHAAFG